MTIFSLVLVTLAVVWFVLPSAALTHDEHIRRGMEAMRRDELDEARENFAAALKLNAKNPHALHQLFVIACQQRRLDDAEALEKRLTELMPPTEYPQTLFLLADGWREVRFDKTAHAISLYRQYLARQQKQPQSGRAADAGLLLNFAMLLAQSGELDEADKMYRSAVKANPQFLPAQLELAQHLLTRGPPDHSQAVAAKSLSSDQSQSTRQRWDEAEKLLEAVRRAVPAHTLAELRLRELRFARCMAQTEPSQRFAKCAHLRQLSQTVAEQDPAAVADCGGERKADDDDGVCEARKPAAAAVPTPASVPAPAEDDDEDVDFVNEYAGYQVPGPILAVCADDGSCLRTWRRGERVP